MTSKIVIKKSSGNVFADLGIPEPETALAKAELARRINLIIKKRGLKQTEAAKLLGIDQAKVSALGRGCLTGFSTERLFRFLNALDRDVEIIVRPKPASRKQAHVTVTAP
jgi:predicted XRE-type DNA-binding protein